MYLWPTPKWLLAELNVITPIPEVRVAVSDVTTTLDDDLVALDAESEADAPDNVGDVTHIVGLSTFYTACTLMSNMVLVSDLMSMSNLKEV